MRRLILGTAVVALGLVGRVALGDVVVNPNSDGSTDVESGASSGSAVPLINPLATNLDLRPNNLYVGNSGAGELALTNPGGFAGIVQNADGFVGHDVTASGKVTVKDGSIWSNANLRVGLIGTGTVDVLTGGLVAHSGDLTLGSASGAKGTMTIDGASSKVNSTVSTDMRVGFSGEGFLHVSDGGVLTNVIGEGYVGDAAGGVGTVTVDGAGSKIDIAFLFVGNFGQGTLNITDGGEVFNGATAVIGTESGSVGSATVDGAGSRWEADQFLVGRDGGVGTLDVTGGAQVLNALSLDMEIGADSGSVGTVTVDGAGSILTANGTLEVARTGGEGNLSVTDGGVVNSELGKIAVNGLGPGTVLVDGPGSRWDVNNSLEVGGGFGGNATATVSNGAVLSTFNMAIREHISDGTKGTVNVLTGGTLRIENLLNLDDNTGLNFVGGTLVFGGDRTYDNALLGFGFNRLLNRSGGVLSLGETLRIDGQFTAASVITIDRGTLSAESIANMVGVDFQRGTLEATAMDIDVTALGPFGDTLVLNSDQHLKIGQTVHVMSDGRVDLTGGRLGAGLLSNDGVIQGDGRVDGPLQNNAGGEVRTDPGQSLLFTGAGNVNDGEINLLGGASLLGATVEFEQDLTNGSTGRIFGRGVFIANGGVTNEGEMAFSGGFTDVHGALTMAGGMGTVITTSTGITTFLDDVDHNGEFIRTSADSVTTFFGDVTGSGPYTGAGTVNFEAGFSPGSSPGEVAFEGDIALGDLSVLTLELGGAALGAGYDHVSVEGNLHAAGSLRVVLIDGFTPVLGQRFDVLSFGSVSGGFEDVALPGLGHGLGFDTSLLLTDGALVVVPEPGVAGVLLGCAVMFVGRRGQRA